MRILNPETGKFKQRVEITSVYLQYNDSANFEMFNCPRCKCAIMQFKGDIIQMIPGFTPVNTPIIIQCRSENCRRKYAFTGFTKSEI